MLYDQHKICFRVRRISQTSISGARSSPRTTMENQTFFTHEKKDRACHSQKRTISHGAIVTLWLSQIVQSKTKQTLPPAPYAELQVETHDEALYPTGRRAASKFTPCPFSLPVYVCWLWERRSCRQQQQQKQSQPNTFAVTVIVISLGCSPHFISFLAVS